jgi:hypothetical protein
VIPDVNRANWSTDAPYDLRVATQAADVLRKGGGVSRIQNLADVVAGIGRDFKRCRPQPKDIVPSRLANSALVVLKRGIASHLSPAGGTNEKPRWATRGLA